VATSQCRTAGTFDCPGLITEPPVVQPTGAPVANLGVASPAIVSSGVAVDDGMAGDVINGTLPIDTSSSGVSTAIPVTQQATLPTSYPTKLGPPIYYGDFRTSSCLSAAADPTSLGLSAGLATPNWLSEEHMFQSKEECCEARFGWAPLENCLGDDWVESNYVRGSKAPTMSPSMMPTGSPSWSPSVSVAPSASPTVVASGVPSSMPSFAVITLVPTTASPTDGEAMEEFSSQQDTTQGIGNSDTGTQASSRPVHPTNPDDPINFLVELLGWANSDLAPTPTITAYSSPMSSPMASPNQQDTSFSISEIILPILEDATISQARTALNFGSNNALAVDGGVPSSQQDGLGERFDSLLKFDIGMIDNTRPLESATLRLYALDDCMEGGTFVTTTDTTWSHTSVSWDSAPASDGFNIGSLSSDIKSNNWYELDMLSALSWNDALSGFDADNTVLSVRVSSSANSRCMYSSMESGSSKAPYMSVRYGQGVNMDQLSIPVEVPMNGQFLLLRATDDSTIDASNANNVQAGTEVTLKVSYDSITRSITDVIIRFDLSQMAATSPRSAVLTLFAQSDCSSAGTIMTTGGTSNWNENDISWSNAPSYQRNTPGGGFNIGTFGSVSSGKWYGFDVAQAIQRAVADGMDAVTFRISEGAGGGDCVFGSRESGRDPKLMVAF
jgi:hypothetical protein